MTQSNHPLTTPNLKSRQVAQSNAYQALVATNAHRQCDVLVIGAGLAGLSTALSLPTHYNIFILAKEGWQDCSSNYAQGGIAAVIDADDSVNDHVQDTLIAGDGLCDPIATSKILSQGAKAIQWLLLNEVPFTTNEGTTTCKNLQKCHFFVPNQLGTTDVLQCADLHLTQEGGHGRRRVAHADDATGKHVMAALHERIQNSAHITLLPYHEALSLLIESNANSNNEYNANNPLSNAFGNTLNDDFKSNTCTGATVYNTQKNELITIHSDAVVLASGGLGQLFSRATAPSVCLGDGIMMAWEAGCRLANLEFVQFHPTGLVFNDVNGSSNFLISEAVRGEGGHLLCPLTGERFMPRYDAREELAPRDIVARAIANEIEHNELGYVYLDISHQPAEFIKTHFPDIYRHCLSLNIDITKQPIPVAPTAHYTCGGVMTNTEGQTDVKGLYAAGEVAHTGLHGANRLASNSLLECVVVGRDLAAHLPKFLANSDNWVGVDNSYDELSLDLKSVFDLEPTSSLKPITDLSSINIKSTDSSSQVYQNRLTTLKQLMTEHMGISRHRTDLKKALEQILEWKRSCVMPNDSLQTTDGLSSNIEALRWQRLLNLAALLIQSALTREESRGGHSRNDYPDTLNTAKISVVYPLPSAQQTLQRQTNKHSEIIFNSKTEVKA